MGKRSMAMADELLLSSSAPSASSSIALPHLGPGMPPLLDFADIFNISSHINLQPFTQATASIDGPSPQVSLFDHIDMGKGMGIGMEECNVLQGIVPTCPSPLLPHATLATPAQHSHTFTLQHQRRQQQQEEEYHCSPTLKRQRYISPKSSSSEVNAPIRPPEINLYTPATVSLPSPSTPDNNNINMEKKKKKQRRSKNEVTEAARLTLQDDVIHVRARRGQATDSHSLAERVRREKISERMRLLQDLVPGCNKTIGKAMMLDEIINYVQSLQNQVEFLAMKLAAISPSIHPHIYSPTI